MQAALIPFANTTKKPHDGPVTEAGLKPTRCPPFQASISFTTSGFKSTYSSGRPTEPL